MKRKIFPIISQILFILGINLASQMKVMGYWLKNSRLNYLSVTGRILHRKKPATLPRRFWSTCIDDVMMRTVAAEFSIQFMQRKKMQHRWSRRGNPHRAVQKWMGRSLPKRFLQAQIIQKNTWRRAGGSHHLWRLNCNWGHYHCLLWPTKKKKYN